MAGATSAEGKATMKPDKLDKQLAALTSDQLDNVKARIEVILRERDGGSEDSPPPGSGEVWGKIVNVLQTEGREAVVLLVKTPFQETVYLEIKMLTPSPRRS